MKNNKFYSLTAASLKYHLLSLTIRVMFMCVYCRTESINSTKKQKEIRHSVNYTYFSTNRWRSKTCLTAKEFTPSLRFLLKSIACVTINFSPFWTQTQAYTVFPQSSNGIRHKSDRCHHLKLSSCYLSSSLSLKCLNILNQAYQMKVLIFSILLM